VQRNILLKKENLNRTINKPRNNLEDGVAVTTTARLHMGFFDLNGNLGRRFGSIGVSLDQPVTELSAWRAKDFSAEGSTAEHATKVAKKLAKILNLQGGMRMQLAQTIPQHAGLGSGTQMALAIGLALGKLYDLKLNISDVAMLTGRGVRSGIGLGAFAAGGVIIDGGRGKQTLIPPVIARAKFPVAWRIILIYDREDSGKHGAQEAEAFRTLPEFPADVAAMMCRHVLMQALPALAEHDLASFGAAIHELQAHTGDYFAPIQSGRYASPRVSEVLNWLGNQGVACYGQSSWGPTGFALVASQNEAENLMQKLRTQFSNEAALEFMLCKGRNQGAVLKHIEK
jgi:beta-ribofuranosylaminobenzene 5'-phosphate synthase